MNNSLSKTLFTPAVACLLGACTENTGPSMEAGDDSLAVRLAGPTVTRATTDDIDDMQTGGSSLSVWGSYTAMTGGTTTNMFDAEKVTYLSGVRGYEGTRYWLPGNTYDFYALYLSVETLGDAVSSVACTDGTFTVNGFGTTKGYGLMTAKETGISVVAGQVPGTVALKFQHLLARLTFVARSEGDNATIRSIFLEGLAVKGDYGGSAETAWNNTTAGKVSVREETNITPAGNVNMSGDLLLIPQSLAGGVKLVVIYDTDARTKKSTSYTLPATTVSMWEAANHYRYSFTLTGGGYIVFDPPTVSTQSDAIGESVTIDMIR